MDEADKLCDRVCIIDKGKVLAIDTPDNLKEIIGGDVVSVSINEPKKALDLFSKKKWALTTKCHEDEICLTIKNAETKIVDIVKILDKEKIEIKKISLTKPSLESVFLHYTGRSIRDENGETEHLRLMRKRSLRGR